MESTVLFDGLSPDMQDSLVAYIDTLLNAFPCGIVRFSTETPPALLEFNDETWRMFGYADRRQFKDDISAHPEHVIPDTERFMRFIEHVGSQTSRQECEMELKKFDGAPLWVRKVLQVIQTPLGVPVIQDTFIDITELKLKQQELLLSEANLRAAMEHANLFFWDYYPDENRAVNGYRSVEKLRMPEVMDDYPECLIRSGFVTPDSAAAYRELHRQLKAGADKAEGIFKAVNPDGTISVRRVKYTMLRDENGRPVKAFGTSEEIREERKK